MVTENQCPHLFSVTIHLKHMARPATWRTNGSTAFLRLGQTQTQVRGKRHGEPKVRQAFLRLGQTQTQVRGKRHGEPTVRQAFLRLGQTQNQVRGKRHGEPKVRQAFRRLG